MAEEAENLALFERLRQKLEKPDDFYRYDAAARIAAVLIPMVQRADGIHLLYILRSEQVSHRGEVAFPGGRAEPGDANLVAAALREATEEVGIAPDTAEVLGSLPRVRTMSSGIVVAPFAALISTTEPLRPNPKEVAEIFFVPLTALRDPSYRGQYERRQGEELSAYPAIFYEGRTIWGLTHRITSNLLRVLYGSELDSALTTAR
jgi:8-oxo-dGTP pyrophosphatase MutT (NUDIX family)